VIEEIDAHDKIFHIPSNKEDEGMGLCAGAWMGGKRPAIIMQNTAIGVTINTIATLIQYYRMPLPMLISYRGELREPVACQVEMAVHTKALLAQMNIPTYHFHHQADVEELDAILKYTFMCNKPVAILTDQLLHVGHHGTGVEHRSGSCPVTTETGYCYRRRWLDPDQPRHTAHYR
jgi:sulfopyruvate decarboxylase subunit alpha